MNLKEQMIKADIENLKTRKKKLLDRIDARIYQRIFLNMLNIGFFNSKKA